MEMRRFQNNGFNHIILSRDGGASTIYTDLNMDGNQISYCGVPKHDHNAVTKSYCNKEITESKTEIMSAVDAIVLRSEIPSGMCSELRTVAASNNRDHSTRSLYYCLFAPHT